MIHPHTAVTYINDDKGYGLIATRPIPRGTITWTLDRLDRVISQAEMARQDPRYHEILMKYSFRNSRGEYIFCWDNGRYINHSFNANCCLTPYNFEIAIRDIDRGEELTDDYGYLNIIEPFAASPEGGERTVVYPDDLLKYAEIWDRQLAAAFPEVPRRKQPLAPFLEPEIVRTLRDIAEGRIALPSIRTCYYDGNASQTKDSPR
ncbi:MAG: SET domain-containing protein [Desulfopila sp.]